MSFKEQMILSQLVNRKALIGHIDRALTTINKFTNSAHKESRLPTMKGADGRIYICPDDLVAIRKNFNDDANSLSAQIGLVPTEEWKDSQ